MSVYFTESLVQFQWRWREIETLSKLASKNKKDENVYNSICRAIIVLMVAHFEGTIRDTAKAIIDDFNTHSKFSKLPDAMKRVFCKELVEGFNESGSKELEQRTQKAIALFDTLSPQIALEPYLREGKNPSPSIIERVGRNFGIKNFFKILDQSDFDVVFINEKRKIGQFKRRLKEYLNKATDRYPYDVNPKKFRLGQNPKPASPTMWEDFVNNLLLIRHGIAHGSNTENLKSISDIIEIGTKLEILEYAFMHVMCLQISGSGEKP